MNSISPSKMDDPKFRERIGYFKPMSMGLASSTRLWQLPEWYYATMAALFAMMMLGYMVV